MALNDGIGGCGRGTAEVLPSLALPHSLSAATSFASCGRVWWLLITIRK